jgi:serine/threonine protein kinase
MDPTKTPSKLGNHGIDLLLSHYQLKEGPEKRGKHSQVVVVKTPTHGTQLAIKMQPIHSPRNPSDRAYRELKIHEELAKLDEDNYCCNFVSIVNWFKIRQSETEEKNGQLMHYVLELAEQNLAEKKTLSLEEMKHILFQILFALHVSQQLLEFNHNDLHLKNILINKLPEHISFLYTIGDHSWEVSTYCVKICEQFQFFFFFFSVDSSEPLLFEHICR